jgi:hypothetical protein
MDKINPWGHRKRGLGGTWKALANKDNNVGKHFIVYIWFSNWVFDSIIYFLKEKKTFENVTRWKEKDWEIIRHSKNNEKPKLH